MAGDTALQLSRFSAKIASTSTGAMKRAVQYDKSSSSDKERLRKFQKNKGRLRAAARAGDEPEVRRLLGRDSPSRRVAWCDRGGRVFAGRVGGADSDL